MISPRPKGRGRDLLDHLTRLLSEQVPEETEPELLQGEPGQTPLGQFWPGRSILTLSTLYQRPHPRIITWSCPFLLLRE
jgi:hypothetical protein